MGDREKKIRSQSLSHFTRSVNNIFSLLKESAPTDLVTAAFDKVQSCWGKLEAAQDAFIEVTDIDIETDDAGLKYLDEPGERHRQVLSRYASFLKKANEDEVSFQQKKTEEFQKEEYDRREKEAEEAKAAAVIKSREEAGRKFEVASVEFDVAVDAFKRLNLGIKDVVSDASDNDRRREWQKLEKEFESLKNQLVALGSADPSKDLSGFEDKFIADVESPFVASQKWFMAELKESSTSIVSSGLSRDLSTKKESVRLPSFKGDEKCSPFLRYSVWRKQWDTLVFEYDEKWRAGLLWDHLDDMARNKFVGWETDYVQAISKLDLYYGDPLKVIACVMKEVMSQSVIADGDYTSLISYSVLLENNFNRLKNLSLEHEMSNTSAMSLIVRKFPRLTGEKWNEHLSKLTSTVKSRPFPEFVMWLSSQREMWERMCANEFGKKGGLGGKFGGAFFVEEGDVKSDRRCYSCGEEGHVRRFCTNKRLFDESLRKPRKSPKHKKFWCAYHKDDNGKRCYTNSCQDLRKISDVQQRIKLLKENGDCLHCCGDHKAADCYRKDRVCGGGKEDRGCSKGHKLHELFCTEAKVCFMVQEVKAMTVKDDQEGVILSIMKVMSPKKGMFASVFWDLGCTSNFVREEYAKLMGFKGKKERLCVTTLGGVVTDYTVTTYKCFLRDEDNVLRNFEAYGLKNITGSLTPIDTPKIKELFPHLTDKVVQYLERGKGVDFLIGMKHPSWHPERAERARGSGDLWLFRGKFGSCIGGRHHEIKEETQRSDSLFSVNFAYHVNIVNETVVPHALDFCSERVSSYTHKSGFCESAVLGQSVCQSSMSSVGAEKLTEKENVASVPAVDDSSTGVHSSDDTIDDVASDTVSRNNALCHATKTSALLKEDLFFQSESLGTSIEPRCGSCKCSKCPVPGSKYSFKEQKEFDLIQKNLKYNSSEKRWYTAYPWLCDRSTLPKNEKIACQSLVTLERNLSRNPELAEDFCKQIEDMVSRGAATVLSEEQLSAWEGDYYYLPLVGVKGKKKWLRLCFDASRRQGGFPSMNDCLHKGPDRFLNNLLSVVIGFRNGRVGCAADISKFHNQVYLEEEDVHMQRFLWRQMRTMEHPLTYAVKVNNFGVKPANCIATSALHKSADHYSDIYPVESQELKNQTYIDDELVAAADKNQAFEKTRRLDEICLHAGMPNKGWAYSGDHSVEDVSIGGEEIGATEKVLGISWVPKSDIFRFQVTLSFSNIKGNTYDAKNVVHVSCCDELRDLSPTLLTRRALLSNVSRIFDPLGLLCPVLLQSKLLMRESWSGRDVGWDDPLPHELLSRWLNFLSSLLSLEEVEFLRSLWPEEEVSGWPILVVFSDGAALAFGAAAYIRWTLASGGFWSRLIMAKSKIAPKNIVSVPRMELNGALLGNRIKNFILKETNLRFSKVYQLVDSSTVLGYIHKECGIFHPYEGIRIAEIQSSNEFCDGKLEGWAWVSGELNPADWCTKPRPVEKIKQGGFWEEGPDFLCQEEANWPIKFSYKTERLEGEVTVGKTQHAFFQVTCLDILGRLVDRVSRWKKMIRVLAWIFRISGGVKANSLSAEELRKAELTLIKYAQKDLVVELALAAGKGVGRFRKLAPVCEDDGVWRVGRRMKNFVPFTANNKMPVIIPPDHRITLLVMTDAHQFSHSGYDGTLCRFWSQGFWTVRAGHLAKTVKNHCVPCRKVSTKTMSQVMGEIPQDQLKDPVAWGHCQMDLFGPFSCRGDVNPRTTKKTWGMVVEDVNSGAVHLDIVQDYSATAVLTSMRRFGCLRGWPGVMYSDPGSQLVSASGKLVSWWQEMQDSLMTFAGSKDFKWEISPADSPWRQGKVERRIAVVKRLIKLSVGDTRLTPVEFLTVLMEIANMCNERPIGLSKPRDDGTYVVLTPNQLLTGRSGNILPDDVQVVENLPVAARYRLINHVSTTFWNKWCVLVCPGLVVRQKWHQKSRNLQVGDLVMIAESSKVKAKYKLGIVDVVNYSDDGCVRSAIIRYFIRKGLNEKWTAVQVVRSVQRLTLILSVKEQDTMMMVKDSDFSIEVSAAGL